LASLSWQIALSMRWAISSAAGMSWLKTAAVSPYSVSLATRTASSTPSTVTIEAGGPKDSSP